MGKVFTTSAVQKQLVDTNILFYEVGVEDTIPPDAINCVVLDSLEELPRGQYVTITDVMLMANKTYYALSKMVYKIYLLQDRKGRYIVFAIAAPVREL